MFGHVCNYSCWVIITALLSPQPWYSHFLICLFTFSLWLWSDASFWQDKRQLRTSLELHSWFHPVCSFSTMGTCEKKQFSLHFESRGPLETLGTLTGVVEYRLLCKSHSILAFPAKMITGKHLNCLHKQINWIQENNHIVVPRLADHRTSRHCRRVILKWQLSKYSHTPLNSLSAPSKI